MSSRILSSAQPDQSFAGLAWRRPLFPYQRTGVTTLLERSSLLLADEMGLGKTIQVIAALRCLFARGQLRTALVVAPAGLVLQWRREIREWAPELQIATVMGSAADREIAWRRNAHVFLASYETVRASLAYRQHGQKTWDVIVLDEAQRIKNPAAEVSLAVKMLKRSRSWALTGTPLENSLDDLVSILDFVAPGRFSPGMYAIGLRRLLAEVQLRRRRVEVLQDLPPKLSTEVPILLGSAQRNSYQRAERDGIVQIRRLGLELRITHVLELILRLKQICNFCPETGASAKLRSLRGQLKLVVKSGERALIFSQFAAEPFGIARLAAELADFSPLVFTGKIDLSTRPAVIRKFEEDSSHKVLLLSLRAGGVGLNLTSSSFVFHFDRWWNPAVEAQAEDRTYRIGQVRTVNVYSYLCADTIEQRIAEILQEKRELFRDVVDGVPLQALSRFDLPTLVRAVDPSGRSSVKRAGLAVDSEVQS